MTPRFISTKIHIYKNCLSTKLWNQIWTSYVGTGIGPENYQWSRQMIMKWQRTDNSGIRALLETRSWEVLTTFWITDVPTVFKGSCDQGCSRAAPYLGPLRTQTEGSAGLLLQWWWLFLCCPHAKAVLCPPPPLPPPVTCKSTLVPYHVSGFDQQQVNQRASSIRRTWAGYRVTVHVWMWDMKEGMSVK